MKRYTRVSGASHTQASHALWRGGQPTIVERAGVAGYIGTDYVARAPADGLKGQLDAADSAAMGSTPQQLATFMKQRT